MSFKEDVNGVKYNKVARSLQSKLQKKYGSWVQVNRHKYKITFCSDINYEPYGEPYGLCDTDAKVLYILVKPKMTDRHIQSTLIHEIGHAEFYESGFKQRNDWCMNNEEHVVETLGESLSHNYEIKRRKSPAE